jgi:hypothetical protein
MEPCVPTQKAAELLVLFFKENKEENNAMPAFHAGPSTTVFMITRDQWIDVRILDQRPLWCLT